VAHEVNYDMPKDSEDFVHRVGRTGRASSRGVASTFASPDEARTLRRMERALAITTKKYRVRAASAREGRTA
jgi:ATP-dependent RNA helicase RhlE